MRKIQFLPVSIYNNIFKKKKEEIFLSSHFLSLSNSLSRFTLLPRAKQNEAEADEEAVYL